MAVVVTYNIVADFTGLTGPVPVLPRLEQQIRADPTVGAKLLYTELKPVAGPFTDVDVTVTSTLTGPEDSALDAVIAAHAGVPLPDVSGTPGEANGYAILDSSGSLPTALLPSNTQTVFVFRPGGTAGGNIYTSWTELMTALGNTSGPKRLEFDASLGAISIPVGGPYDMTNTVWAGIGSLAMGQQLITVPEGVSFTGLRFFDRGVLVRFTGTTPPVADLTASSQNIFFVDSSMQCVGAGGSFFQKSNAGGINVSMFGFSQWSIGAGEIFDLNAVGVTLVVLGYDSSVINSNTVRGVVGSTFIPAVVSTGSNVKDAVHANFSGTLFSTLFNFADRLQYVNGASGLLATDVQGAIDEIAGQMTSLYDYYETPLAAGINVIPQQAVDFDITSGFAQEPDIPRSLQVVFSAGWDGGNIEIDAQDLSGAVKTDTIVAAPGTTVQSAIAPLVVQRLRNLGTRTAGTVDIQLGEKLGIRKFGATINNFGQRVDSAPPTGATVVDATNGTVHFLAEFPNGARSYQLWYK